MQSVYVVTDDLGDMKAFSSAKKAAKSEEHIIDQQETGETVDDVARRLRDFETVSFEDPFPLTLQRCKVR